LSDIFEYDVFLSFASADEELVKPIWQEMSLSGLRVFWSDETLKQNIGQSFVKVIQNALIQSRHFVLICTQNSMQSKWVEEEYNTFYSLCYLPSDRKRRLMLLKIKDFNLSSLPPFLRIIQLSDSVEQIISMLGGVNIQALKQENRLLKQRVENLYVETERLRNEIGLKEASLEIALNEKTDLEKHIKEHEAIKGEKKVLTREIERLKREQEAKDNQIKSIAREKEAMVKALKDKGDLEKQIQKLKEENENLKLKPSKPSPKESPKKPAKSTPTVQLRSEPIENFSTDEVKKMLKERDFYDNQENKQGKGLNHQYKVIEKEGEKLVIDYTTGLTWQQSGSPNYMEYSKTEEYIKKLNDNHFAGYDDWRLPTLEEAMSLMEPEKKSGGLYISKVFDQRQSFIWTADKESSSAAGVVYFASGCRYYRVGYSNALVRAVR
jgi:hypothetical protein